MKKVGKQNTVSLPVPEKLEAYVNTLGLYRIRDSQKIGHLEIQDRVPERFSIPDKKGPWKKFRVTETWGQKQAYAYFRGSVRVPQKWNSKGIAIRMEQEPHWLEPPVNDNIAAGPEGQLFVDGKRVGAIDNGHKRMALKTRPGQTHNISAIFFAGRCACRHVLKEFRLDWVDLDIEALFYDLKMGLDRARTVGYESQEGKKLLVAVSDAAKSLGSGRPSAAKAKQVRRTLLRAWPKSKGIRKGAEMVAVGHAHIDLAWLWPGKQSKHKCVRTFSTQIRLLDQYPNYVFLQSSPQAYLWVKEEAPDLYEQIKAEIKAGRWEAEGATWCEMDTNITGGESLVRQFLYGKRFFKEEFGNESRFLWLPDVFGYSAALPQIMKLAGVRAFATHKLAWIYENKFPFSSFRWKGLDGSDVAAHLIATSYNSFLAAAQIKNTWDDHVQKDVSPSALVSFGFGDGGGGPTEGFLEKARRLGTSWDHGRIPPLRMGKAGSFLGPLAKKKDVLPTWEGELYFESHRGTYTSQAWLKRANRKNEIALHNLEWLASLASFSGWKLNKKEVDTFWQDLMFMQFHDILPGSSVGEVYDDARVMQDAIARGCQKLISEAASHVVRQMDTRGYERPVVLFNTLSWDRRDPVCLPDGSWRDDITIPAGGWAIVEGQQAESSQSGGVEINNNGRSLKNKFWKIELDEQGRIESLWDRKKNREVLADSAKANEWQVFADKPKAFDAWDIDADYINHPLPGPKLVSMKVLEQGPVRGAVQLDWEFEGQWQGRKSRMSQQLVIYANNPRIDFVCKADWHQHHQLLKVAFPVSVKAAEASHEIQFGHLKRATHSDTPREKSKFETSAHRFVDLSDENYGVALMNDCKYGYDVKGHTLRLTCIKCATTPHTKADQGNHEFTFSLLPHEGSLQESGVIRAAAELNVPPVAWEKDPFAGSSSRSMGSADPQEPDLTLAKGPKSKAFLEVSSDALIVDTLKPAEDGKGLILRLYESHGSKVQGKIDFTDPPRDIRPVDLLERPLNRADSSRLKLKRNKKGLSLEAGHFQIISLRLLY